MTRERCARCRRVYRGRGDWNGTFRGGVCVGLLCPGCQTPEENAESAVNEATLDYGTDALGRVVGKVKS